MVQPRPTSGSRAPVAPHTPRSVVVAAILSRIRDRLFSASGSSDARAPLTLESVLSLFEMSAERGASTSRETLACLLGHMRLGISVAEADELVSSIAGGSAVGGGSVSVQLSSLYEALRRAGEPEQEVIVDDLREAARDRFLGRGSQFAEAAQRAGGPRADGGDWLPETEFRRCLAQCLADDALQPAIDSDEEDKVMLLVEKSASGAAKWRHFAMTYQGWQDDDYFSDPGLASPPPAAARSQLIPTSTQQTWHQTWRSGKTVPERNVFCSPEKQSMLHPIKEPPPAAVKSFTEPEPQPSRGFCRCLTRFF